MTADSVREAFRKAAEALEAGRITEAEHDTFLIESYGTTNLDRALHARFRDADGQRFGHDATLLVTGFFVIAVALFSTLFYTTGGITGAVVLDLGETYGNSTNISITLNGTTQVNLTGRAEGLGDVTIRLLHDGRSHMLLEYREGPLRTDHAVLPKRRYEEGETVSFNATNVSSAWLIAEEAVPLGNAMEIVNLSPGNYSIKLIINDSGLVQESLPFRVVPTGTALPSERFAACACDVNLTGNGTIEIVIEGNASVHIEQVGLGSQGNRPPVLQETVPDMTAERTVQIDIARIFADPDGDELLYDSSEYGENNESINGSILTIAGEPGTYTYVLYASDLEELASSNMFTVTFTGNTSTNTSSTAPAAEENAVPATSSVQPNGLCNHPDPDKRPLECLQEDSERFFQEQRILLRDGSNNAVARVTPIGNLLIGGTVHEQSTFSPDDKGYVVSYEDEYGEQHVTVWFDSLTGDLWLAGQLHEEMTALSPPAGSFAIRNRQGITLLWADPRTGDLYVRGNVIPGRGAIR